MNNNNRNNNNLASPDIEVDTPNNNSYTPLPPDALEDVANTPESNETAQSGGSLFDVLSRFNQELQQGGRSRRRKTAKRKNRRAMTRRRR